MQDMHEKLTRYHQINATLIQKVKAIEDELAAMPAHADRKPVLIDNYQPMSTEMNGQPLGNGLISV